jgi:molybdopterin-guanine dinucleotide biosynthesis protein A
VVEGAFSEVSISGDFTILPKEAIGLLEARLSGLAVKPAAIEEVVEDWFTTVGVDAPGLSPADLSAALSAAVERPIE